MDNMPGGVDKIGHSSIQPWSAGELFPAVLARVELNGGAELAWDLVHYEVIAYGDVWEVAPIRIVAGVYKFAAKSSAVGSAFFSLGRHDSLYDAAAQLALGLVMAHEESEHLAKSIPAVAKHLADKAAFKEVMLVEAAVDVAAAQAALEAGFAQMEKDLAAMGALPAYRDEIVIIDECSRIDPDVIKSFDEAVAAFGAAIEPDPGLPIPDDYWMERKALLCSDHPAEDPPAAESWLERRPARDCGVPA